MKSLLILLLGGISITSFAQGVGDLLSPELWNALFPKRAGTYGIHPQGYTDDFYSYENLMQAANEMANFSAEIHRKSGVWGELTYVTQISTNTTFLYSEPDAAWFANPNPEIIDVVNFSEFVNTNSTENNIRELAAFLANISKETTGGWQLPVASGTEGDYATWGLYFVHEVGYNSANAAGSYSQANANYPPNPAVGYYGRGPIQLSWNYNYGLFSKFLFNNPSILLDNPNLVQEDGVLAFKSAIWFWMMPQCPKPSCHQVMHEYWQANPGQYAADKMYKNGFAHTNNIINGGLECRNTSTPAFTEKVHLRSELYKYYLSLLGFTAEAIALENTANKTTLCYESSTDAMEDYNQCMELPLSHNDAPNKSIKIYPNPSNQLFTLELTALSHPTSYRILSSLGKTLEQGIILNNTISIDLSTFTSGIYFLKISDQSGQVINLIKQ